MKIEDQVMRGGVWYIESLQRNESSIIIRLLGDPNEPEVVRILSFSHVQQYSEEWYDRDTECIEMLIGLHEKRESQGTNYILHTDQREMFFYTETEPEVKDL